MVAASFLFPSFLLSARRNRFVFNPLEMWLNGGAIKAERRHGLALIGASFGQNGHAAVSHRDNDAASAASFLIGIVYVNMALPHCETAVKRLLIWRQVRRKGNIKIPENFAIWRE